MKGVQASHAQHFRWFIGVPVCVCVWERDRETYVFSLLQTNVPASSVVSAPPSLNSTVPDTLRLNISEEQSARVPFNIAADPGSPRFSCPASSKASACCAEKLLHLL